MLVADAAAEEVVLERHGSVGVGEVGRRVEQDVVAVGAERIGYRGCRRRELVQHVVVPVGERGGDGGAAVSEVGELVVVGDDGRGPCRREAVDLVIDGEL